MHREHFDVYSVREVWRQLRREGVEVARCTVARLMRETGLQGAVRALNLGDSLPAGMIRYAEPFGIEPRRATTWRKRW